MSIFRSLVRSVSVLALLLAGCKSVNSTDLPDQMPASETPLAAEESPEVPAPSPVPAENPPAPVGAVCFVTTGVPIAFMPDNQRIVLKTDLGVQIFNLGALQTEKFIQADNRILGAAAISPDGGLLAWVVNEQSIELVSTATGQILHSLSGSGGLVTKLRFSPDGKILYAASHDTWVRTWGINGELRGAFQPTGADNLPSDVLGLGVSSDGRQIATIPFDGPVKVWDAATFELVRELGAYGGYDTSDVAFSADNQFVAADTANGLFVWRTVDGKELVGGNPGINSMEAVFSPDGRFLAYTELAEQAEIVIAAPDGRKIFQIIKIGQSPAWSLIFSADSSLLAAANDSGVQIFRVEDGNLVYRGKQTCPSD